MTDTGKTLTSSEYSKKTGIPVPTVTSMLRRGKLRGEKRGGKWAIFDDRQAEAAAPDAWTRRMAADTPSDKTTEPKETSSGTTGAHGYDINTFAQMTYLTKRGVRQWFKKGRLSGSIDSGGNVLVDAENLDRPEIRHLIRK